MQNIAEIKKYSIFFVGSVQNTIRNAAMPQVLKCKV